MFRQETRFPPGSAQFVCGCDGKPGCAAAYRMSLEERSRWRAGGSSGGSGFGAEERVIRLEPITDASRQDEEKKEYRQIEGDVVETIPG